MSSCMLLFAILAVAFAGTIATDYCNLESCAYFGYVHTMCKYTSPAPSSQCRNWRNQGLTPAEKQAIVDTHNEERRKVAAGKETRGNPGPQPAAVNMPDLVWNNELEIIAQRWVNQCTFGHDECRDVAEYSVGQNAAVSFSSSKNNSPVEYLVKMWINEVELFHRKFAYNLPEDLDNIGHYTQVVSGSTKTIGCGRIFYQKPNGIEVHFLICNYGPSGNFPPGKPIYQIKN